MVQVSDDGGLAQMAAAEVLGAWTHFRGGSRQDFLTEQMRDWGTGGARLLPRFLAIRKMGVAIYWDEENCREIWGKSSSIFHMLNLRCQSNFQVEPR